MLKQLKKKIIDAKFTCFKKSQISFGSFGELILSADCFSGYSMIKETVAIGELVNEEVYNIEYLNDNVIKIMLK